MQFSAYDPNRYDVCGDPDCKCRSSRGNICGFGATEEEALADFWDQYISHTAIGEMEEANKAFARLEEDWWDRRAGTR